MHDPTPPPTSSLIDDLFARGGEMAALMCTHDWAHTPLGPVETWSPTLRTMVKLLLVNRFPILMWWGPRYCQLYNDAYRPILGTKHPRSLGQSGPECWPEIWDIIGPLASTPFEGGPPTWDDDIQLEVNRYGFVEETHFTIAYSPIPDDTAASGIGGVLATVHEITRQVIQERRVVALRDLGARSAEAKSAEEACEIAAEALSHHPFDVPFVLLYLVDADQRTARLTAVSGTSPGEPISPRAIDLTSSAAEAAWPLAQTIATEQPQLVEGLSERFALVPAGPWSDPPDQAIVFPIPSNLPHRWAGFLVLGISARLELDRLYHSFGELATAQVGTAIANARAYDEERQRAEALAELDRAKTAFFSNVSHEFRTPLTLLLGPVEDLLDQREDVISPPVRQELEVVHRNSLRLFRLVNTLLDFSRLEAGRTEASYEPTDLARSTAELASTFRSAVERAGLRLVVDCPPLPEPVYVDREMWEKVVLNLLSNAFKFTFEGEIAVSLRAVGPQAELTVRDTGSGIPEDELPRIFERFHRVRSAQARTHEGTGIGLPLAQEIVKLHQGSMRVESAVGQGSTFIVAIPRGTAHLPADRIEAERTSVSTATGADSYVEEALRWLPEESYPDAGSPSLPSEISETDGQVRAARVLLADDNADMRDYVRRLLAQRWQVEAVADGAAALAAARERPPDLILADVMMPGIDGFELLRELRADPLTQTIPIILLSARAGEEARVEGLEAGADDYLTKPFAARELIARVDASLTLARFRREAAEREQTLRAEAEQSARTRADFMSVAAHELRTPLTGLRASVQLLLYRAARGETVTAEQTERLLRTIDTQSRKLGDLVIKLLDVTRIEAGRLLLDAQPHDVTLLVEEVAAHARMRTARHDIVVRSPGETLALVDPLRIEQVLTNLVDNAVKYSPTGGDIIIDVERPNAQEVSIAVSDHGIGIDPEHLPHIFDRFYQVDQQSRVGGMGIGLYVSQQIVQQHGGEITVEPNPGGGSRFVVRLPSAL